jgi:hypothetical protein
VQKATGLILAGNTTWKAAKEEGYTDIAVIELDVADDQAIRILLADNRTAQLGDGYDDRLLAELLGDLPDLDGTGFDQMDLDALIASLDTLPGLDDLLNDTDDHTGDGGGDSDLWPVLRVAIPAGVLAKWKALLDERGGNEAKVFADLVGYEGHWL